MFVLRSPSIVAMTTAQHIPADCAHQMAAGRMATVYVVETDRQGRRADRRRDAQYARRSCKR